MEKIIKYEDVSDVLKNESSIFNNLSMKYEDVSNEFLNEIEKVTHDNRTMVSQYNNKLAEIKNLRHEIVNTKYTKDKVLNRLLEVTVPPRYLKYDLFNYKALVLYFLRNFRDMKIIKIDYFKTNSDMKFPDWEKYSYKNKMLFNDRKLYINTHLTSLLHLINIDKDKVKTHNIYEQIIYETIEYGDHIVNETFFKSKVASISWVKGTLANPDFIYSREAICAKRLDFDIAFIRETGTGNSSQKYMYHLVGLRQAGNSYAIVSQFPIELDRKSSARMGKKVSQLQNYVICDKPIFKNKDISLPVYEKVKKGVEKLIDTLGT